MLNTEPVDILVVDDNDSDRTSIVAALHASVPAFQVAALRDGAEALDFLFARGVYRDRVGEGPPRLILLDLEMPGVDGFSVLEAIRSFDPQTALRLTPVVVFSGSREFSDVHKSYCCGANSYIVKPVSYPDFQALVKKVGQYWMNCNHGTY